MSVANIIDPATGLIKEEFATQSKLVPTQVIGPNSLPTPAGDAIQKIIGVGDPPATFTQTTTACSSGQIWIISGIYTLNSVNTSVPGGPLQQLWVEYSGGAGGIGYIANELQTPSTASLWRNFSIILKVPTGRTSFSLKAGNNGPATTGDINCLLYNCVITQVIP